MTTSPVTEAGRANCPDSFWSAQSAPPFYQDEAVNRNVMFAALDLRLNHETVGNLQVRDPHFGAIMLVCTIAIFAASEH